jgi:hypothetical protein
LGTALDAEGKLREGKEILDEYREIEEKRRETNQEIIDAICQQQYMAICGAPPPPPLPPQPKPKPGPKRRR